MRIDYMCHWGDDNDESVVISSHAHTWMEQVEVFKRFLLACGYILPEGDFQLVRDDDVILTKEEYRRGTF